VGANACRNKVKRFHGKVFMYKSDFERMVLFAFHYLVATQVAVFSQINIAIKVQEKGCIWRRAQYINPRQRYIREV
jgi:hypothetical protein